MFSETMSAFTEVAEMKTKIAKTALYFQANALSVRYQSSRKWELEKHQRKKKTTSVDEKEKVEVKLHAAVVLNITFWTIYEPRSGNT